MFSLFNNFAICFLRQGSVILDSISEITGNDNADVIKQNFDNSLIKFNNTNGLSFQTLSVKVTDLKKEPERLKGYEIALVVIGCIFGVCFIFLLVYFIFRFFNQYPQNRKIIQKNYLVRF